MAHELIIELVETKNGNFNKVTCPEGCWITSWNDGDDILTFNASKIICCPLKVDITATYHCIDEVDYNRLENARNVAEEVRRKEEEERMKLQ